MSLFLLLFSSAEEKTRSDGDGFPEKNGTGWSGRIVELDLVAIAAEFLAIQIMSMMFPFSAAEEKTSIGGDACPRKNGTGWSSRVVASEREPVAFIGEVGQSPTMLTTPSTANRAACSSVGV